MPKKQRTKTQRSKKPMPAKDLQFLGSEIRRPMPLLKAEAGRGVQEPLLSIEVENPSDKPVHVWASRRAYDYDAATHVLTLYLTEHTPPPPPAIKMISDHPRNPVQVEVKPKSRATIDVQVPGVIRRRVPGKGLGMAFVEEPIEQVERVDIHIQYADEPIRHIVDESPADHRTRLRAHGRVVQTTLTPTEKKEE
jgi:hypothetical protein